MKITRRKFLAGTGIAVAATKLASATAPVIASAATEATIDGLSIRDQFNLSREYIHLSSFFIASHPKPVRDAIDKYRKMIDDNPFITVEHGTFGPEADNLTFRVKKAAAEYFEAKPEEFALTGSTTMGLALVYQGMRIQPGQEILTTNHDHYSHHESIRLAAERSGASVKKIALYDSFDAISADSIVARIRGAITPKTRAVGITWVHSSSGLKLPVSQIAAVVREANNGRDEADRILLVLDGVHGIGLENETVGSLGCDFLAAGTHKWLFGPRGTGILWGNSFAWSQIRPTVPSFDGQEPYMAWMEQRTPAAPTQASWVSPGGFAAFEHLWAAADAFRFHLQLGKKRVADQIHELNTVCKKGLAQIPKVKVHTPKAVELSAGIICFDIDGMKPETVVEKLLQKKIIASTSPYAVYYARVAPSLVNAPAEIETTLRELREIAKS